MQFNRLIPELTVGDIEKTKQFYLKLLGFRVDYERECDRFMFISLDNVQFMLEEYHEDGWNVAEMEYPFGRGVNFSIEVDDMERIYKRLISSGYPLYRPMTNAKYEANGETVEQKEFLVQDPDGYLLRFTQESKKNPHP